MADSDIEGNGHIYGNFSNYYSFHTVNDRINYITKDKIQSIWNSNNKPKYFTILDIGCNEGNLSIELLKLFMDELKDVNIYLIGIDIDGSLINKANQLANNFNINNAKFITLDIMNNDQWNDFILNIHIHLPESFIFKPFQFNLVTIFSVTMWIHLNHNDSGLTSFLNRSLDISMNSLIIEPQTWKSYKSAVKRCKKLDIHKPLYYSTITMRENISQDITDIIMNITSSDYDILGTDSWGRSLYLFTKNNNNHDNKQDNKRQCITSDSTSLINHKNDKQNL